jgi:nitrate/nitrite transporter NarK|tara:strand:- start:700 stop:1944 length:1245 start_codon:yes stop_codon:yes gene_type:complete
MPLLRHWLTMIVLSISGGIIFLLPFLQEVYYKPLAQALSLNNTEVGSLMSVFGVTSLISYFPGGLLADRVSPRKLISLSLLLTGITGLYFSTFPGYGISLALHAFWGVSISLLFWGAMIRMTRNWAPADEQGRAFGILETGRGLGEVLSSAALLSVFVALGSGDYALSMVIVLFSGFILALGILAWFTLEDKVADKENSNPGQRIGLEEIISALKMPVVWLIATVILTGYCAYWGTFRFTSYATDIFTMSVAIAASISVGKMWLKPLAAFIAGFIADRFGIARTVASLFLVLIVSFCIFAVMPGSPSMIPMMLANVAVASLAVFAMRGIYFALLEEGGIPMAITGTVAGIVSAVGFTPDIFMPLLGGVLLDTFPGATGYRYFFLTTAAICAVGFAAALIIYLKYVKGADSKAAG